jgi:ribosome maturation factor RimP
VRDKTAYGVIELLEPLASQHGFDLVDVQRAGAAGSMLLRVYLDREDGVTIDAIAQANSWISAAIDSSGLVRGSYTLEVSSPGIDRPLRTLDHFRRQIGATVKLKTAPQAACGNRAAWTGVLTDVAQDSILIETDGGVQRLDFDDIRQANVKGVVDFQRKDV